MRRNRVPESVSMETPKARKAEEERRREIMAENSRTSLLSREPKPYEHMTREQYRELMSRGGQGDPDEMLGKRMNPLLTAPMFAGGVPASIFATLKLAGFTAATMKGLEMVSETRPRTAAMIQLGLAAAALPGLATAGRRSIMKAVNDALSEPTDAKLNLLYEMVRATSEDKSLPQGAQRASLNEGLQKLLATKAAPKQLTGPGQPTVRDMRYAERSFDEIYPEGRAEMESRAETLADMEATDRLFDEIHAMEAKAIAANTADAISRRRIKGSLRSADIDVEKVLDAVQRDVPTVRKNSLVAVRIGDYDGLGHPSFMVLPADNVESTANYIQKQARFGIAAGGGDVTFVPLSSVDPAVDPRNTLFSGDAYTKSLPHLFDEIYGRGSFAQMADKMRHSAKHHRKTDGSPLTKHDVELQVQRRASDMVTSALRASDPRTYNPNIPGLRQFDGINETTRKSIYDRFQRDGTFSEAKPRRVLSRGETFTIEGDRSGYDPDSGGYTRYMYSGDVPDRAEILQEAIFRYRQDAKGGNTRSDAKGGSSANRWDRVSGPYVKRLPALTEEALAAAAGRAKAKGRYVKEPEGLRERLAARKDKTSYRPVPGEDVRPGVPATTKEPPESTLREAAETLAQEFLQTSQQDQQKQFLRAFGDSLTPEQLARAVDPKFDSDPEGRMTLTFRDDLGRTHSFGYGRTEGGRTVPDIRVLDRDGDTIYAKTFGDDGFESFAMYNPETGQAFTQHFVRDGADGHVVARFVNTADPDGPAEGSETFDPNLLTSMPGLDVWGGADLDERNFHSRELEVQQDAKGGDTGPAEDESIPEPGGASVSSPAGGGPRIIINPSTFRNEKDALCVAFNEAFRLVMEEMGFNPVAEPTEAQRRFFSDTAYRDDELQLRRTILARICTFDTSVKDPTDEQLQEAVEFLTSVMEAGAPQNEWEQQAVMRLRDVIAKVAEKGQRESRNTSQEESGNRTSGSPNSSSTARLTPGQSDEP